MLRNSQRSETSSASASRATWRNVSPTLESASAAVSSERNRLAADVYRGEVGFDELRAPQGAREYARRLAQHGVTPTALVRAYRLGQQIHLTWAIDELVRTYPDPVRVLAAVRTLLSVNFRYIDAVSEQAIEEYQAERERWVRYVAAVDPDRRRVVVRGAGPGRRRVEDAWRLADA
ncbi:hypothetical protein [Streptomyces cavernicola]|uniref:RsbT co-antagonist protein RsbRD N-terminal domain-containing protein n=1 Tax=Streptomyces cavernicola TaxID=3043613 RepID=A0ABT6SEW7_9ACTN|nr:hypothetical protein [Streptomyces sp. B-S-A6]MDI3406222.1 hypothetical protein [Streptomyces sp. B-S-A6]